MRAIFRSSLRSRLGAPQYTVRSWLSVGAFGVIAVALAAAALWPLLTGNGRVALFAAPLASLIGWCCWVLLARPVLIYDAERALVINSLRAWDLPWSSVQSTRQRLNLEFVLRDGRRVPVLGAPPPKRGMPVFGLFNAPEARNFDGDTSVFNEYVDGAAHLGGEATVRWSRGVLWFGVGLAALTVLSSLVEAFQR